jgi:hypothetical protein
MVMVKKGMCGIYAIVNMLDWKQYIGQAVKSFGNGGIV